MRASAGTRLFHQGDRPIEVFALQTGWVDLMRWTASGSTVRIHAAGPGEMLAEASLFAETYHCDAVARDDVAAICFEIAAVLDACKDAPSLSFAVMQHLATSLRDARRRIELRSINPLANRLETRLAEIADAGGVLPETLIMKDVAAEIGATPEATYRALAELIRQGRMLREGRARFRLPARSGVKDY